MALIVYGPIVDQVAGSIGGTTFARSAGGRQGRSKPKTCNASTVDEYAAKATISEIAKRWQLLTSSEHDAWTASSKTKPYTNRVGRQHALPGYQFFVKLNTTAATHGIAALTTPPTSFVVAGLVSAIITPIFSGGNLVDLTAEWNGGSPVDSVVQIQATGRYGMGFVPDHHRLLNIATFPANTTSPVSIGTQWAAVHGQLPTDQPWQALFRLSPIGASNAWKGCPQNYVLGVGATASTIPSPPTITRLQPASGTSAGGSWIEIIGTSLRPVNAVNFGTIACQRFRVHSAALIKAETPPLPPGTYDVTLDSEWGCSPIITADEYTALGLQGTVNSYLNPHRTITASTIDTDVRGKRNLTGSSIDADLKSSGTPRTITGSTIDADLRTKRSLTGSTVDADLASGAPTLSVRQAISAANSSSTANTISWTSPTLTGSALYALVHCDVLVTVTFPPGWSLIWTQLVSTGQAELWQAPNATSAPFTSISFSATCNSSIAGIEIQGATTSPTDQQTNTTGSGAVVVVGPTGLTTSTPEVAILAIAALGSTTIFTPGAGWTTQTTSPPINTMTYLASQNLSTLTTVTGHATLSPGTSWAAGVVTVA